MSIDCRPEAGRLLLSLSFSRGSGVGRTDENNSALRSELILLEKLQMKRYIGSGTVRGYTRRDAEMHPFFSNLLFLDCSFTTAVFLFFR